MIGGSERKCSSRMQSSSAWVATRVSSDSFMGSRVPAGLKVAMPNCCQADRAMLPLMKAKRLDCICLVSPKTTSFLARYAIGTKEGRSTWEASSTMTTSKSSSAQGNRRATSSGERIHTGRIRRSLRAWSRSFFIWSNREKFLCEVWFRFSVAWRSLTTFFSAAVGHGHLALEPDLEDVERMVEELGPALRRPLRHLVGGLGGATLARRIAALT